MLLLPELDLIKAEQARRNFKRFIVYVWPQIEPGEPFVDGWHIDALVEHLVAVYKGQIRYLLINIPPRHCKSLLLSVLWPVWVWLQNPFLKFVYASYSMDFSLRDSFKALSLMKSEWFQLRYSHIFTLNKKKAAPKRINNDKNGFRFSTSIDAGATGEGGNFIVCFAYNTEIKLKYNSLPIGTIVENKLLISVLSWNHLTNKIEYKKILRHFESEVKELVEINYGDHEIILCTRNHPFFVLGKGYVNAENLQERDILLGQNKKQVFVNHISFVQDSGTPFKVYNIEVEANNNYFAAGVLVHNCDDAHNTSEAESKAELLKASRWWFETMGSRGNDPKTVAKIVQGQRQSDLDLYAEILRRNLAVHLCLPQEFDGISRRTVLGNYDRRTKKDELLWPERFGEPEVASLKLELGPHAYAAQYQQNPTPRGGNIIQIDWFDYYDLMKDQNGYIISPAFKIIYQSWDTAFKEGEENDFSVCQTWGIGQNGFYLIDQFKKKITFPTLEKTAIMLGNTYLPRLILVEDKASGQSLVQSMRAKTKLPFKAVKLPYNKDKAARLKMVSGLFEGKRIFLPREAPWVAEYIDTLTSFPTCLHDDEVDATTQFLIEKGLTAIRKEKHDNKPTGHNMER